jgi:hypothetical protein
MEIMETIYSEVTPIRRRDLEPPVEKDLLELMRSVKSILFEKKTGKCWVVIPEFGVTSIDLDEGSLNGVQITCETKYGDYTILINSLGGKILFLNRTILELDWMEEEIWERFFMFGKRKTF